MSKKMRTKKFVLLTAFAMVLLFAVGSTHAATVSIVGPEEVMIGSTFTFDVIIDNIGDELADLDAFDMGLVLSPESHAKFMDVDLTSSDGDYVFYGINDKFLVTHEDYLLKVGDVVDSHDDPVAPDDAIGKLLARIQVDLTDAVYCEWYTVSILEGLSGFSDRAGNDSLVVLSKDYGFHSVPIPGTVLLLGSGVVGLFGLKKERSKRICV